MPRAAIVSLIIVTRSRSSLAMTTSSSTIATTWSSISVAARAAPVWSRKRVRASAAAASRSVSLVSKTVESSNHVAQELLDAGAKTTEALELKLDLVAFLRSSSGESKLGTSSRTVSK
jgi:hypothetical protein